VPAGALGPGSADTGRAPPRVCHVPPFAFAEAPMEILLLLADEIDDFCAMAWQRARMLLGQP
jgi:hypothetical protein